MVKSDVEYLRVMGCNAQYIPNPTAMPVGETNTEKNALIWVGRFESHQKRPEHAIYIMERVVQKIPDARLYFVGTADSECENSRFRALVREKSLEDNIVMSGFCPEPQKYYKKASLLLMTSSFEVWGMVLTESMAHGLPIVCYEMPYLEPLKNNGGCITVAQEDIDGAADAVTIAKIAQYAENEYFGKPCGLMDQTACAVGSFVTIDFADPKNPAIEEVKFDFAACSHALCIVDTKGSHSDLTDEYAYIREEMESVAQCFGKAVLREVPEADFYAALPSLRKKVGDRAILRAMHFYADNARVLKEVAALRTGDFESFKQYIRESGFSSFMYNQNVFSVKKPQEQPVALALAISQQVLEGRGAWRVHGGGFAGTIQAFVPLDLLDAYKSAMESVFGAGTCYVLSIRPVGGVEI